MGLENRQKTNQIFDGSKLSVPGQGIKTVKVFKDILKNKDSLFSPSDIQNEKGQVKPTPQPTKTPRPTPNNTPTQTTTPSFTPTMTKTGRAPGTPLPTRTPTKTPASSSTPTNTLTPSRTVDSTPIPTRTNTPSNTQTGTVALTPSTTQTSTPNTTPSYTPSVTPTLTPNGCFCYDIEITQSDLNSAYGNTEQIANGILTIQYFSCSEEFITLTATTAGTYKICNRKFETLDSFGIEALLVYTQLDEVYNNYLNPNSFSSTVTTLYNSCSVTNDCIPPTTTPTMTQSQTPTNSATATITPSQTPSNTVTPSYTPTNQPTPTTTPTNTQTPTLTPYICYSYDVTITQTDIDRASGNTGTNGVVSITYYSCDEVVEELEVTVAGVYTVCNKYIKSNDIYNTEIYLVYRQDDEAYNNYENPSSFTSSFVRTSTICPTEPPPPPPPPCNPLDLPPLVFTKLVTTNYFVQITLQFTNTPTTIIDWGDGTTTNVTSSGVFNHTYSSNISEINIYCCDFSLLETFIFIPLSGGIRSFSTDLETIGQLLTNLKTLDINYSTNTIGDIQFLSQLTNLETLSISCISDEIYGDITYLPENLTSVTINGGNITGDLSDLSSNNLVSFYILSPDYASYGNTLTGDIGNFLLQQTELKNLSIFGKNTIYGDIANISNFNIFYTFVILGLNVITGDIGNFPSGMGTIYITGSNTIYGDISNVTLPQQAFIVEGNNTITGDIASFSVTTRQLIINGLNTIYGDLQNFPSMNILQTLNIDGNNTITGSLDNLVLLPRLTNLVIKGNNTVTGPVSTFMTNINSISIPFNTFSLIPVGSGGLTSSEVDYVLIQFTNRNFTTAANSAIVTLTGVNAPRTSASDIAVNYLQSKGVIVNTN